MLLYVDDMLVAGPSSSEIQRVKGILSFEFDMKDLGITKKLFGMSISRNSTMKLSQSAYLQKMLTRFSMENAKEVTVPLGGHYKLSAELCPSTE